MPGILRRKGVYSVQLCYKVFSELCFKFTGSSGFGICFWVDDQVV